MIERVAAVLVALVAAAFVAILVRGLFETAYWLLPVAAIAITIMAKGVVDLLRIAFRRR